MSEDTEPMPLDGDRRQHRKLWRFDPTVSSGALLQIVTLTIGLGGAYATYRSDQATMRLEIDQVKATVATEKTSSKEALGEIKNDVKEVQRTLNQATQTLAVIQAQQQPVKAGR